jgi:adenosylcobinamide-phosphate synthase
MRAGAIGYARATSLRWSRFRVCARGFRLPMPLGSLPALAAALLLDRLAGDPPPLWRNLPHPVVLFGRLIDRLERQLNRADLSFRSRRRHGLIAVAIMLLVGAAVGIALTAIVSAIPFGVAVEAILASVLFAQKSLVDHVRAVARALASGSLDDARAAAAQIVGRDVTGLDVAGVARAAIESAAENFSDAVVAPAFWYALAGLPGLMVYKLVNTADSMIGHRSPRYEAFGWAAARLDDFLNLVPARIAAVLVAGAGALAGANGRRALVCAWRDAGSHRSPNAGWPEAAVAGALGLALGGPRRYGALEVDGAWLNADARRTAGPADIEATLRLVEVAWALLLAIVLVTALASAP